MRVRTAALMLQRPAAQAGAARVPAPAGAARVGRAMLPSGRAIGRVSGRAAEAVPKPMPGPERAGWST
jgi:hypothetical protein